MGLIDNHIKKIIELSTLIDPNDIFNIYQLKGALPEKIGKDDAGNKTTEPYTQQMMFVLFGVEEGENGGQALFPEHYNCHAG